MGTSGYRAPELVRGIKKVFTNKVDIWAIGCIFYELVFRRRAFYEDYDTLNYSFEGTLHVPPVNSDNIWDIIPRDVLVAALEKFLNIDPKKRPTAIEIRQQFHSSGSSPARLFASDETNNVSVGPQACLTNEIHVQGVSAVATHRDLGVSKDLVVDNDENSYRTDPAMNETRNRSWLNCGYSGQYQCLQRSIS